MASRFRFSAALMAGSLALAVCFAVPVAAQADGACEQVVLDSAGVLGDSAAVIEAASKADELGTVRVVVVAETTSGLFDDLVERSARCAWVDADGTYLPDHLVIAVSIADKATQIVYGSQWETSLADAEPVIVDRVINPQFATGNFSGGLVSGLEQLTAIRLEADTTEPLPATTQVSPSTTSLEVPSTNALEVEASPEPEEAVVVAADGESGARLLEGDSGSIGWLVPAIMVALLVATAVAVVVLRRAQSPKRADQ